MTLTAEYLKLVDLSHAKGNSFKAKRRELAELEEELNLVLVLRDQAMLARRAAYEAYCVECELEQCVPHTISMWILHDEPKGPLG